MRHMHSKTHEPFGSEHRPYQSCRLLKEERALFSSPIAYVVMTVFLLIMGYSSALPCCAGSPNDDPVQVGLQI